MGLFGRFKKQEPIESAYTLKKDEPVNAEYEPVNDISKERNLVKKEYHVVGTEYHANSFKRLAIKNQEWGKAIPKETESSQQIYRYNYVSKPCELVEENDNVHDHNAVKVMIAGKHVGYISAFRAPEVRDILDNHEIKYISACISGGEFKVINNGKLISTDKKNPQVDISIGYIIEE